MTDVPVEYCGRCGEPWLLDQEDGCPTNPEQSPKRAKLWKPEHQIYTRVEVVNPASAEVVRAAIAKARQALRGES